MFESFLVLYTAVHIDVIYLVDVSRMAIWFQMHNVVGVNCGGTLSRKLPGILVKKIVISDDDSASSYLPLYQQSIQLQGNRPLQNIYCPVRLGLLALLYRSWP